MYSSAVVTTVLYGLESLQPTDNAGRLLDTFQLKGLRKILQLETTYMNRNNTHNFCLPTGERSTWSRHEWSITKKKTLTEMLEEKRIKLLGPFSGDQESTHNIK